MRAQLQMLSAHHHTWLARIPMVVDVQSAWLLLVHCASAMWPEWLSTRWQPRFVRDMTPGCGCLCRLLHISPEQGDDVVGAASMPFVLGGIGLASHLSNSTPLSSPSCDLSRPLEQPVAPTAIVPLSSQPDDFLVGVHLHALTWGTGLCRASARRASKSRNPCFSHLILCCTTSFLTEPRIGGTNRDSPRHC